MKKTSLIVGMLSGSLLTYVMMNDKARKKTSKLINSVIDEADNMINRKC